MMDGDAKPSKLKLKKTRAEIEDKRWRRDRARLRKETRQIYKANGLSRDDMPDPQPPLPGEIADPHTSAQPGFRRRETVHRAENDMDPEMEYKQRMYDVMMEGHGADSLLDDYPAGFPSTMASSSSAGIPSRHREFHQPLDVDPRHLTDEEYAEAIREGMWRWKNRAEVERQERVAKEKEAIAKKAARLQALRDAEEAKRIRVIEAEGNKAEERRNAKEVAAYQEKWQSLSRAEAGSEAVPGLRLVDLPWPILLGSETGLFHPKMLQVDRVGVFFEALHRVSGTSAGSAEEATVDGTLSWKQVLRAAILAYHPDRFVGRYLERVVESEREVVRDAIIRCSQIINDLASRRPS